MDKASLIGTILGVVVIVGTVGLVLSHGGNIMMFWSLKGVIMVFGGTLSVLFMAMPMDKLKQVPGYIKAFMREPSASNGETVTLMATLSDKARRDGILALESEIEDISDPFLAQGLKMAVDGTDEAIVETTLRLEVMAMQERHKAGKKFFDLIKLYGPGYGLAATLIGQIGMFGSLGGSIEELGGMLAVAVTATMYGTVLANAIAGPIGDKLSLRSGEEILAKEMMLQGIMSIQAGDNPRTTTEKMLAFVPQSGRGGLKLAA
ncbi:MAG: MotA/TolQ/ExbB proton channel family protein [Phycisphaerales bacterium]|nr:MotA/TolQ/ExbB proton channel family protein [Phycisphaerales bacterium]MDG1979123.1 MotA/TolQ/ExbB proton channel family protein [Phycisphaerales bacterium]MDG2132759.1 MotA/TolQ/ExbB proton channel family protein [Phycisphaerales bacterium]